MDEREFWNDLLNHKVVESDFAHIEVSADLREAAHATRDMYVAFRQEGFTEREALTLIASMFFGGKS